MPGHGCGTAVKHVGDPKRMRHDPGATLASVRVPCLYRRCKDFWTKQSFVTEGENLLTGRNGAPKICSATCNETRKFLRSRAARALTAMLYRAPSVLRCMRWGQTKINYACCAGDNVRSRPKTRVCGVSQLRAFTPVLVYAYGIRVLPTELTLFSTRVRLYTQHAESVPRLE